MRGFAQRATVEQALAWLDRNLQPLGDEQIPIQAAADRVLANDVVSQIDVPGFHRSMMDGYAVVAEDTEGASSYNRYSLEVIGESLPGNPTCENVVRGKVVKIMTGAPLPPGADAVLPAELTETSPNELWIQGEVSPGKHVGQIGEDVAKNTVVLTAGRKLRPQDLGVLSSIGIDRVFVVRQVRVRIVVTGDELLPAGTKPEGCRIADANGPMLDALAQRDGAVVVNPGIVRDNPDSIRDALHHDADVILVSGGSSVGQEDHAPIQLAEHGELAIHGIAMRPSSPAGMGRLGDRYVFLLPGNPVSCLCAYDFFAGRAIRTLGGLNNAWPYRSINLTLRRKLVSAIGRVDYARIRIVDQTVEPLAISGASVLSSTTRADGFVVVPADSEGYPGGAEVRVYLYDV